MKLNHDKWLFIGLVLIVALFLSSCKGTETVEGEKNAKSDKDSKEVIEMDVNNFYPSTNHLAYNAYEPWKELVEEKTEGRVKVNLYHGGSLGGSNSVWQDVTGGVYDVGLVVMPYYYDTELFPFTIGGIPFAFPDAESATRVMEKFNDKYGEEVFKDAVYMGMVASDSYNFFSPKPVKKLEDVKKKKIRVTGKGDTDLVKDWGAVPVSISLEDLYDSLQKGTVDITVNAPTSAITNKYQEVAPYMTELGMATAIMTAVMNQDFYNRLPDDLKEIFDKELNPKLAEMLTESYVKESKIAYEKFKKDVGDKGEIITLSSEELKKFKAPSKAQWDEWVEDANKKGYPGEEMMIIF